MKSKLRPECSVKVALLFVIPFFVLDTSRSANAFLPSSLTLYQKWNSRPRHHNAQSQQERKQKIDLGSQNDNKRNRFASKDRRVKTPLFMGLRSLLGLKNNDKNNDDSSNNNSKENNSNMRRTLPPITDFTPIQQPLRMGENPKTKEVDVHSLDKNEESIQERINRVKAGKMTEEEKYAFLQSALSAVNTADSRRKPWTEPSREETSNWLKKRANSNASPFPTDSILRNFARGQTTNATSKSSIYSSGENALLKNPGLDSEKKKREYLDMVTDPGRFQRYNFVASKGYAVQNNNGINGKFQKVNGINGSSQAPVNNNLPPDLGARLEAAALAETLRQQNNNGMRSNQNIPTQSSQQQNKRSIPTYPRPINGDSSWENSYVNTRNREDDVKDKEVEKERLEQLMKAQEEYWKVKVAAEKAKREGLPEVAQSPQIDSQRTAMPVDPVTPVASELINAPSSGSGTELTQKPEMSFAEKGKLGFEDAPQEQQPFINPSNINVVEEPATYAVSFVEEQTLKKLEMDQRREEQLAKLAELNSLPSRPKESSVSPAFVRKDAISRFSTTFIRRDDTSSRSISHPSLRPSITAVNARPFQPQKPLNPVTASPHYSDVPAPKIGGSTGYINEKETSGKYAKYFTNGQSGKQAIKMNAQNTVSANSNIPKTKTTFLGAIPIVNGFGSSPRPNERRFNGAAKETSVPVVNGSFSSQPVSAEKKRPIRMQVPLEDEEEEDDEIDVASIQGMSIKDALSRTMKGDAKDQIERSKKYGVDISRFLDE